VHLNYIAIEHIELLAAKGMKVAYCPRASRYFGHPCQGEAPHRWREMIARGIPVALGTDGRPCLPGPARLSVLDDALTLVEEDGARLEEWLAMATINGARAIGIDPAQVTLAPGRKRGILVIPLEDPGTLRPVRQEISWLFFDPDAPVVFASEDA
jgi:5-methylthioadenosine/S-adenosylhomocysteine deaminase